MDKAAIKRALLDALDRTRAEALAAQRAAQDATTHEEARAESDKDMRSTETSYVARGQAMRVESLDAERARVAAMPLRSFEADDAIAVSALVTITNGPKQRTIFVAVGGGGRVLAVNGTTLHVVTPSSPLGEALVGARAGDELVVERGQHDEELTVMSVA